MRLSVAIDFLDRFPDRRVKSVQGNKIRYLYVEDGMLKLKVTDVHGMIHPSCSVLGGFNNNMPIDDDSWTKVYKEVTYSEALEEWKNGKAVMVEGHCTTGMCAGCCKLKERIYNSADVCISVCRYRMLHAKWFVLD